MPNDSSERMAGRHDHRTRNTGQERLSDSPEDLLFNGKESQASPRFGPCALYLLSMGLRSMFN